MTRDQLALVSAVPVPPVAATITKTEVLLMNWTTMFVEDAMVEGVGVDSVVAEQRVVTLDDGEVRADLVRRQLDRVQLGVNLVARQRNAGA